MNTLEVIGGGKITTSTDTGTAGNLSINQDENPVSSVQISGADSDSGLGTEATGEGGDAGSITINTRQLTVSDEAKVSAEAKGKGGDAGSVTINVQQLTVADGAEISARNVSGTSGDIILTGLDTLEVLDSTEIAASTQTGTAGKLSINENETPVSSVQISGQGRRLSTQAKGKGGQAGSITINAQQLTVADGAEISARNVSGTSEDIILTGLNTLEVLDGGKITASTETGTAGKLSINKNKTSVSYVQISGAASSLAVQATGEGGVAGGLTITTDDLTIRDGAEATVNSPRGQAGTLTITADSLKLDNGKLTAIAGRGDGGNITLTVRGTLLRLQNDGEQDEPRNGFISAQAVNQANGGNVILNVQEGFVLASPHDNTDILASAERGNGGRITINTFAIFGLEEREPTTRFSDINASSEFGTDGEIVLNTLGVDPTRGLDELPSDIVDVSSLVAEGCIGSNRSGVETQGEFTRTGRGGLSPAPTGTLSDESLIDLSDPGDVDNRASAISSTPPQASQTLVEAQGLARDASGKVSLVASSSKPTVPSPLFTPNTCDAP